MGSVRSYRMYNGTSLTRNSTLLGLCSRPMPGPYGGPSGGGVVYYERGIPVRAVLYVSAFIALRVW